MNCTSVCVIQEDTVIIIVLVCTTVDRTCVRTPNLHTVATVELACTANQIYSVSYITNRDTIPPTIFRRTRDKNVAIVRVVTMAESEAAVRCPVDIYIIPRRESCGSHIDTGLSADDLKIVERWSWWPVPSSAGIGKFEVNLKCEFRSI